MEKDYAQEAELVENAARYAKSTAELLADLSVRNRLLLASELKQRGAAIRAFAGLLYPSLELSVQWNRVRFYSPQGSYWHALGNENGSEDPDWAIGFWSLTHWLSSAGNLTKEAAGGLLLGRR